MNIDKMNFSINAGQFSGPLDPVFSDISVPFKVNRILLGHVDCRQYNMRKHAELSYGSGHVYGVAFNKQELVAFQRDDLHRETPRIIANGLM